MDRKNEDKSAIKIPGNISDLYEYAEQTGTHIPKYPFRAGYLRAEYNNGWLADDYGKTPDDWFEQLEKAKEQYGDVNIIACEISDLKKWLEKKSNRQHEISDLKVGMRRCGITRRKTGNQFDFFSVDFDYGQDVHIQSMARQINGCYNRFAEFFVGTEGVT